MVSTIGLNKGIVMKIIFVIITLVGSTLSANASSGELKEVCGWVSIQSSGYNEAILTPSKGPGIVLNNLKNENISNGSYICVLGAEGPTPELLTVIRILKH